MVDKVRGTLINFSATIVDKAGAPATPDAADLYLTYTTFDNVRTKITIAMTINANVASVDWDSSVASAPSDVKWSIRATGANSVVQDGSLSLTANEANPTS